MGLTRRQFLAATAALATAGAVPRWCPAATPLPDAILIGAWLAGLAAALAGRPPLWKDDGLSANMWTDGLPARTFGQLDDAGEVVSVLVTACGNKATALDRMGRDAAVACVIREFEDLPPASRRRRAPAAWRSWGLDSQAAGDWAVFAPGTVTRFLPATLQPHGRVHFCGERTALANRGMEGAMESGERAALEALEHL